jgi:hypothetical protein
MGYSDIFGYDLEKGIHNLLYQQQKKLRLPRRSQVNSLIPSFAQFSFFELPPSMQ